MRWSLWRGHVRGGAIVRVIIVTHTRVRQKWRRHFIPQNRKKEKRRKGTRRRKEGRSRERENRRRRRRGKGKEKGYLV
jgi:hypothetical protein